MKRSTKKGLFHAALVAIALLEERTCKSKMRKLLVGACAGWHAYAVYCHFVEERREEAALDVQAPKPLAFYVENEGCNAGADLFPGWVDLYEIVNSGPVKTDPNPFRVPFQFVSAPSVDDHWTKIRPGCKLPGKYESVFLWTRHGGLIYDANYRYHPQDGGYKLGWGYHEIFKPLAWMPRPKGPKGLNE